ncbi:2-hydroxyacid dehydrogenase [Amaricoccus solimangrovi]|uniref:D-glycerate dehydrogenase n=1 Tax=Amaricoccus solimangrovi TaxID=2589815 RepID=A0A501WNN3_9RHOB|nr:D-glycerate dehydrogenase [Amaricoccus solimangrovi]TPE51343.1 D-glycerate dehydrogenase [Amaricoccus solimangrovi]
MSRPRVIVTRKLPDPVEERLGALFDVTLNPSDRALPADELKAAMREADGVLCAVVDPMTAEVLGVAGRRAGIVANFGVGVNNIDLKAAEAAGIAVGNTPDVLTDATADIAIALMLAATRRMYETEKMLREGRWKGFSITAQLGMGLRDKVIGIVGMGRIGQATARRAALGFGMKVIYFNRSDLRVELDFPAERRATIEEVMAEADVVSLHIPGGGENRGRISAAMIAAMKPTAYLVNTARGDVVDEPALVAALAAGRIAGAGLDVFAEEPKVPAELVALENVTLLPHIGSATLETRTAMGMLAVDNLEAFFAGRPMPARVV